MTAERPPTPRLIRPGGVSHTVAVVGWCSFLGAIVLLLATLSHPLFDCAPLTLPRLSRLFIAAWVLTALPVALALSLASTARGDAS